MANRTVTMELSSEVYDQFQMAAEQSNRSVEALLEAMLSLISNPLALDTETTLNMLDSLPDEYLWIIAYLHLTPRQENRLRDLVSQSKTGNLSPEETSEEEHLLALVDRHMLLRSKALLLLKQRGHDLKTYIQRMGR